MRRRDQRRRPQPGPDRGRRSSSRLAGLGFAYGLAAGRAVAGGAAAPPGGRALLSMPRPGAGAPAPHVQRCRAPRDEDRGRAGRDDEPAAQPAAPSPDPAASPGGRCQPRKLRTPFAVLRGELELAGRPGRSREELVEAVARASEEVARLARITECSCSSWPGLTRTWPPVRRQATDLRAVCWPASATRPSAARHEAGVSCDVRARQHVRLAAYVDPDRIREAVDNLVDNALRGLRPASNAIQIVLAASAVGRDLVVAISDDGARLPGGLPATRTPSSASRGRTPGRARADGGRSPGTGHCRGASRPQRPRRPGPPRANRPEGGGAVVTLELPGAVRT